MLKIFCNHKWEVKHEKTHLSPVDRIKGDEIEITRIPQDFFLRTDILVIACDKCGKLKTTITKV